MLTVLLATWTATASPSDEAAILELSDRFHHAIAAKDTEAMLATFHKPDIPFLGTWEAWVEEPDMILTGEGWFSMITGATATVSEEIRNPDIEVAGRVASMRFDYQFVNEGVDAIHGREFWNLLKTDAGWKITAVTWHMHPSGPRREPAVLKPGKLEGLAGSWTNDWGTFEVEAEAGRLLVAFPWDTQPIRWYPSDRHTLFRHAYPSMALHHDTRRDTLSFTDHGAPIGGVATRTPDAP